MNIQLKSDPSKKNQPLVYKALVALKQMSLEMDKQRFMLSAGMQTNAEIRLGDRTVMEYLLSPVRKAWHEEGAVIAHSFPIGPTCRATLAAWLVRLRRSETTESSALDPN